MTKRGYAENDRIYGTGSLENTMLVFQIKTTGDPNNHLLFKHIENKII